MWKPLVAASWATLLTSSHFKPIGHRMPVGVTWMTSTACLMQIMRAIPCSFSAFFCLISCAQLLLGESGTRSPACTTCVRCTQLLSRSLCQENVTQLFGKVDPYTCCHECAGQPQHSHACDCHRMTTLHRALATPATLLNQGVTGHQHTPGGGSTGAAAATSSADRLALSSAGSACT